MKIKFSDLEHENEQASIILLNAITNVGEEFTDLCADKNKNNGGIDIQLIVEGREVPFTDMVRRVEEAIDRQVEQAVIALVQEKAGDILDKCTKLTDDFTASIYKQFKIEITD